MLHCHTDLIDYDTDFKDYDIDFTLSFWLSQYGFFAPDYDMATLPLFLVMQFLLADGIFVALLHNVSLKNIK